MNDDKVTDYAFGQFRRVATLIGEPDTQAPQSPPGMARRSDGE